MRLMRGLCAFSRRRFEPWDRSTPASESRARPGEAIRDRIGEKQREREGHACAQGGGAAVICLHSGGEDYHAQTVQAPTGHHPALPRVLAMSAALAWLGGTEEEVSRKEALAEWLCGLWQDTSGSVYRLTHGSRFTLDVLTTRACGAKRFTSALIRCTTDDSGIVALWGRTGHQYRGQIDGSQLKWRRAGSEFRWQKLQ